MLRLDLERTGVTAMGLEEQGGAAPPRLVRATEQERGACFRQMGKELRSHNRCRVRRRDLEARALGQAGRKIEQGRHRPWYLRDRARVGARDRTPQRIELAPPLREAGQASIQQLDRVVSGAE